MLANVNFTVCTEAEQINLSSPFVVADGSTFVYQSVSQQKIFYTVFDASGRCVKKSMDAGGNVHISADEFTAGIYFITIQSENERKVYRFVLR